MESTEAPYIHPDILRRILSKLPVKSLLRFRCVCKSWNHLISKSEFVTLHLEQSVKRNENIILSPTDHQMYFDSINSKSFHKQHPIERYEFPPEFQGSSKSVVGFGSCNGLILLVDCHENIFLWNPSTRESRKLSCPHTTNYASKKIYGLSYDSENSDYMLGVVNFIDYETTCYNISVFSLNKLEWTKISFNDCSYRHCETYPELPAVVLNGALHWFVVGHNKRKADAHKIVAFDLAAQSLKEMKLRPHLDGWDDIENFCLGVLRGCLCLIGGSCDDISKDVYVHSMGMQILGIHVKSLLIKKMLLAWVLMPLPTTVIF